MAKKKHSAEQLTEVARNIGTKLGGAVAQANRVVKGVKAAARAGKEAYSRTTKKSPAAKPAKKKRSRKRAAQA
jgi:hypothetical protein